MRGVEDWEIEMAPFPTGRVAACQLEFYGLHRDWLLKQRSLVGDKDGRYSQWIKEATFAIAYWQILVDCQRTGMDPGVLHRLIGSERFLNAWHPPLLPEPPCPPTKPTPPPNPKE